MSICTLFFSCVLLSGAELGYIEFEVLWFSSLKKCLQQRSTAAPHHGVAAVVSDICFFTVCFRTSSDRDAKGMKGSSKEKEGGGGMPSFGRQCHMALPTESSASVYSHGDAGVL